MNTEVCNYRAICKTVLPKFTSLSCPFSIHGIEVLQFSATLKENAEYLIYIFKENQI
jgi:hypothetical protein